MASSCAVQVKLELGHRAQVRKKPTVEGFTHDWMVFVRGPEHSNIQHFVEKVVFHLHDSFPRPKREVDLGKSSNFLFIHLSRSLEFAYFEYYVCSKG
uniref:Protein AF-9 n=1 Tax=Sphaerodactylus townsendi TaxID=933632 RepID=A0ACB8ERR3_9SAUR